MESLRAQVPATLKGVRGYADIVRGFSRNAKLYMVFTVVNSVSFSIFNLVFNLYIYSLGYRQDFIGVLNALPSIAILALGLPVGMAADRYGYKPFLVAGAIITAISTLGMGLFAGAWPLMFFSLLGGVAGAMSWVIGAPMMMQNSAPEERVYLFSVNFALMMGSGLIGSLVAGTLPEVFGGWLGVGSNTTLPLRFAFLSMTFFNIIAIIPIAMLESPRRAAGEGRGESSVMEASGGQRAEEERHGLAGLLQSLPQTPEDRRLFLKLIMPSAIIGFGAGAMVVFFQLFFNLKFKLSPGSIGIIFALSSVVTGLASLAAPVLAKRWGKVRTVVWTELASIPFLLILAYSDSLWLVIGAFYVRSALMNMGGPVGSTFSMEMVKENQRATLTSLGAMLGSLGRGGLGPLASGFLQTQSGFGLAFTLTTATYVLAAGLFYYFFRDAERPNSDRGGRTAGSAAETN